MAPILKSKKKKSTHFSLSRPYYWMFLNAQGTKTNAAVFCCRLSIFRMAFATLLVCFCKKKIVPRAELELLSSPLRLELPPKTEQKIWRFFIVAKKRTAFFCCFFIAAINMFFGVFSENNVCLSSKSFGYENTRTTRNQKNKMEQKTMAFFYCCPKRVSHSCEKVYGLFLLFFIVAKKISPWIPTAVNAVFVFDVENKKRVCIFRDPPWLKFDFGKQTEAKGGQGGTTKKVSKRKIKWARDKLAILSPPKQDPFTVEFFTRTLFLGGEGLTKNKFPSQIPTPRPQIWPFAGSFSIV